MTSILLFHIISASVLTVGCFILLAFALARRANRVAHFTTTSSFMLTLMSGGGLLMLTDASLTHFCLTMTAYSLLTFVVRAYYIRRTATVVLPSATDV